MNKYALYIFTASLLATGVYLHSAAAVISGVVLWGIAVAESVVNRKNRDTEIAGLILRMEKVEMKNKSLEHDVMNVAERAKTILGETF